MRQIRSTQEIYSDVTDWVKYNVLKTVFSVKPDTVFYCKISGSDYTKKLDRMQWKMI